jgi:excinuclease UvrABC ATPase subunit
MQTVDQIVDSIMELEKGTKILVMAPVIRGKKGEHAKVIESAIKEGYVSFVADDINFTTWVDKSVQEKILDEYGKIVSGEL